MIVHSIPTIISLTTITKLQNHQVSGNQESQQNEEIQILVIKEFFETSIPFINCVSFVIAYYGPFTKIHGNIGNDDWHYEKVTNINKKLIKIAKFFCC